MACIEITNNTHTQLIPEGKAYPAGWHFTGKIAWDCGSLQPGDAAQDFDSLLTSEGIMVGNIIKKVTSALGIKQCMACKGRQRRYNEKGLAIQRKLKDLL